MRYSKHVLKDKSVAEIHKTTDQDEREIQLMEELLDQNTDSLSDEDWEFLCTGKRVESKEV